MVVFGKTFGLIRELCLDLQSQDILTDSDANDLQQLKSLSDVFADIVFIIQQRM